MVPENHQVLIQAGMLGEVLQHAKDEMDPAEFLQLLTECNATIRQIIKIDYGTVCAPSGSCSCAGPC